MAFKYNVNLIRDRIARRRLADNIFRLFTFLLLLFAVMLFVTVIVYQIRQGPISVMARQSRQTGQLIERRGIDPARVEEVQKKTQRFEARMIGLKSAMQSSVPWVETINTITAISMENGLIVEKIESSVRGGRIIMNIEGVSYLDYPVNRIHQFALKMEEHELFTTGRMTSIASGEIRGYDEERVEIMRFKYEVPFKHPLGSPGIENEEGGGS